MRDEEKGVGLRIPVGHTLTIRAMDDLLIYALSHRPDDFHVAEIRYTATRVSAEGVVSWPAIETGLVQRLVDQIGDHMRSLDGTPVDRNPDGTYTPRRVPQRFRLAECNESILPCPRCHTSPLLIRRYPAEAAGWRYTVLCESCKTWWEGKDPPILAATGFAQEMVTMRDLEDAGEWVTDV